MKTQTEIDQEVTDYMATKIMSPETRQWLIDEIASQGDVIDPSYQDMSDKDLFLLWLRS